MRPLLALLLLPAALPAGELRVGRAAVRITPPPGMPMAGYYYNRGAEGVHDDLYAKAIVLDQDGARAALVACDLANLPADIVTEARRNITERAGMAGERAMISATHCHTGPLLIGPGSRTSNMEGEMLAIARRYAAELPVKIAESVRQAAADLRAARLRTGIGHENSVSFNRRYFMSDGTVGWNPGKLNPKIVRPAGVIDPALPVVYFESADGRPLATYVNFALHLDTVGGQQFSADYPYTISTLLAKIKGPEMLTLFTNGAAGNVNHIDVRTKAPQKGHEEAARIGTVLAGEVLKTYARMEPVEPGALDVRREVVKLPLAPFDAGELEKARAIAAKYGKPGAPFMDMVWAFKVLEVAGREGRPIDAEVMVVKLGNRVAWVGMPGEIFAELGLALKQASPVPFTVVTELAGGTIGYVPDRAAYPQGAYEVVSARCAAGGGEMLVDAALRLLGQ